MVRWAAPIRTSAWANSAGADVVHRSVGEHPLGPDPALGEVGGGPEHEPGARRSAFIAKDLDVGVAGAVVDRSVEVVVTRSASPWTFRLGAEAQDPPPAARPDPRELLHVDVDKLAGTLPLEPDRCRGWPIQVGEP